MALSILVTLLPVVRNCSESLLVVVVNVVNAAGLFSPVECADSVLFLDERQIIINRTH